MTIHAWYMDDEEGDQRLPHQLVPNQEVKQDHLDQLGILSWSGLQGAEDPKFEVIRAERGYNYTDVVTISPEKLPDYDNKIKSFFREHIHYDEEIRFCLEGGGYFDMRDESDRWIRIAVEPGGLIIGFVYSSILFTSSITYYVGCIGADVVLLSDMIILPEGSYHRFTCDASNYGKFMRLFVGDPVWTPYNREEIDERENASRKKYVETFLDSIVKSKRAKVEDEAEATATTSESAPESETKAAATDA